MKDARKSTEIERAGRQRAQRATRGLVAGYIHELSERHGSARGRPTAPAPTRDAEAALGR